MFEQMIGGRIKDADTKKDCSQRDFNLSSFEKNSSLPKRAGETLDERCTRVISRKRVNFSERFDVGGVKVRESQEDLEVSGKKGNS